MALVLVPIAGAAVVALVLLLLDRLLNLPHDPQEPPLVRPKIPLIGHVIGLLRHGTRYYSMIADECKQPIFTLGVPRGKMYIVTSPGLIAACDRRSKVVSFAPYVVEFGKRILAGSEHSVRLLSEDLLEEKEEAKGSGADGSSSSSSSSSLRPETMAAMHRSQAPGEHLDALVRVALRSAATHIDSITGDAAAQGGAGVPLFGWVRQFMTRAGTDAVYGEEKNPFRDPEVAESFWAVDRDFALLGLMVLPDLLAPRGSRGRKRFFRAFREYYASGGLETASSLIKARYEVNKKYGVSDEDIARFDLGVCTALLVNTAPAVGWTLCHAYSDRALLAELRRGIEAAVFPGGAPQAAAADVTVNICEVAEALPLLESFVREVLRVQSNSASARFVLRDTVLDEGGGAGGRRYLVKAGSFLGMPSAPVHGDEAVWGPTARSFDPTRFLPERQKERKIPASAWRTFGGGNALCPGRHLALREIMSVLVVMVLRFDLEPCEDDGRWEMPAKRHHISTSILTPVDDIRVRIRPRKELAHVTSWNFVWEPTAPKE
ncbi:cytochrome P450 [Thermothelomyces heterothallicus CBS 202.75]|uniref:cytochrome P450 n=1 Tax=Thermothelomyces heterothallicus CBS 202.75 TaxID=1149848 RepID=UPI0037421301